MDEVMATSEQTWTIIDLQPNKQEIGCKLVYKIKRKAYGGMQKYKVRLPIKGRA